MTTAAHDLDLLADAFAADGCVCLGTLLSTAEVASWKERFDRCRRDASTSWRSHGGYGSLTADILVLDDAFDALVREPRILAVVDRILGAPPRFWETSIRHLAGVETTWPAQWHVDSGRREHWVQAMVYLTDTTDTTHHLRVIPRAGHAPSQAWSQELASRGHRSCTGPAGTVWLFQPSCWHSPWVTGGAERASLQTYYCTEERPIQPLASAHSTVPRRLWAGEDADANAFYRLAPHGQRTRTFLEAFAPAEGLRAPPAATADARGVLSGRQAAG